MYQIKFYLCLQEHNEHGCNVVPSTCSFAWAVFPLLLLKRVESTEAVHSQKTLVLKVLTGPKRTW